MLSAICFNLDQSKVLSSGFLVNSFPKDKILDLSKLKALACNKIEVPQRLEVVLDRTENNLEKGENARDQNTFLKALWIGNGAILKVPVNGN